MSLFRQKALDKLSSPEQLDQPLQLIRPSYWTLLLSLLGFSLSIFAWSIFGRLPVRLSGQGVLIRAESLEQVQSETPGRVEKLMVNVGDCVRKGQAMARLESVQQDLEEQKAVSQLQLLVSQDQREDSLAKLRENELKLQIARVEGLAKSGAISQDDLATRRQLLSSARIDLETRNSQREQQILEQRNQIRLLNQTVRRTAIIEAPQAACVVDRDVKVGEVVQAGTTLFELERRDGGPTLQSIAFFKPGDGKRLKEGQRVQVTPASANVQRHGGIEGVILMVRPLPVSNQAITNRLGNAAWMKEINPHSDGPLIEVLTSLRRNPATVSGYDWGGGSGPDLKLTPGTPTNVRVLVEQRQPISYIIPLLRNLSGIY